MTDCRNPSWADTSATPLTFDTRRSKHRDTQGHNRHSRAEPALVETGAGTQGWAPRWETCATPIRSPGRGRAVATRPVHPECPDASSGCIEGPAQLSVWGGAHTSIGDEVARPSSLNNLPPTSNCSDLRGSLESSPHVYVINAKAGIQRRGIPLTESEHLHQLGSLEITERLCYSVAEQKDPADAQPPIMSIIKSHESRFRRSAPGGTPGVPFSAKTVPSSGQSVPSPR